MSWLDDAGLAKLWEKIKTYVDSKMNKSLIFITGTGTTAGTWLGTHADITEYYDGLTIAYKVGIAGASTTTLNINDLGAVKVVRNNTSAVTTQYAVTSVLILTYTVDGGTAYWKVSDYDSNNKLSQYSTTTNADYPVLFKYASGTSSTSTNTNYARFNNSLYYNPSTGELTAPSFKGNFVGNITNAYSASTLKTVDAISEDGKRYNATVEGVTELVTGLSFMITPNMASTINNPLLNVNGLGAKALVMRSTDGFIVESTKPWLTSFPVQVTFVDYIWVVNDYIVQYGEDLRGVVPVSHGGTGRTEVDEEPTEDSKNMVRSGGVFNLHRSLFEIGYKYEFEFDGDTTGKTTVFSDDVGLLYVKIGEEPLSFEEWETFKIEYADGHTEDSEEFELFEDGECYTPDYNVYIAPHANATSDWGTVFPEAGIYVCYTEGDDEYNAVYVGASAVDRIKSAYLPKTKLTISSGSVSDSTGNAQAGTNKADLSVAFDITTDDAGKKSYTLKDECLPEIPEDKLPPAVETKVVNDSTKIFTETTIINQKLGNEICTIKASEAPGGFYISSDNAHPLLSKQYDAIVAKFGGEEYTLKPFTNMDVIGTGELLSGYIDDSMYFLILFGQLDLSTYTLTSTDGITIGVEVDTTFYEVEIIDKTTLPYRAIWTDKNGCLKNVELDVKARLNVYGTGANLQAVTVNGVEWYDFLLTPQTGDDYAGSAYYTFILSFVGENSITKFLDVTDGGIDMNGETWAAYIIEGEKVFAYKYSNSNLKIRVRKDYVDTTHLQYIDFCKKSQSIVTEITIPEDKLPEDILELKDTKLDKSEFSKTFNTVGGDTLTWDGNTEGLDVVDIDGDCYYISDVVPTWDDLQKGCVITIPEESADVTVDDAGSGIYVIGPFVIMSTSMMNEATGKTVEKGIYIFSEYAGTQIALTINGYTGFKSYMLREEVLPPMWEPAIEIEPGHVFSSTVVAKKKFGAETYSYKADEFDETGSIYFETHEFADNVPDALLVKLKADGSDAVCECRKSITQEGDFNIPMYFLPDDYLGLPVAYLAKINMTDNSLESDKGITITNFFVTQGMPVDYEMQAVYLKEDKSYMLQDLTFTRPTGELVNAKLRRLYDITPRFESSEVTVDGVDWLEYTTNNTEAEFENGFIYIIKGHADGDILLETTNYNDQYSSYNSFNSSIMMDGVSWAAYEKDGIVIFAYKGQENNKIRIRKDFTNDFVYVACYTLDSRVVTEMGIPEDKLPEDILELKDTLFGISSSKNGDTLTWDGNTEGLYGVGGMMYRVSDNVPTKNDFINGASVVVVADEGTETVNVSYEEMTFEDDGYIEIRECVAVIPYDNYTDGGVTAQKKGIYFAKVPGYMSVASLTINGYTGFTSYKLKESLGVISKDELFETSGGGALTWDGNTDVMAPDPILTNAFNIEFYKISSQCPNFDEALRGGTCTITNGTDSITVEFTETEMDLMDVFYAIVIGDDGYIIFCIPNSITIEGLTLEKGVYMTKMAGVYASSLSINGYSFASTTIKKELLPSGYCKKTTFYVSTNKTDKYLYKDSSLSTKVSCSEFEQAIKDGILEIYCPAEGQDAYFIPFCTSIINTGSVKFGLTMVGFGINEIPDGNGGNIDIPNVVTYQTEEGVL